MTRARQLADDAYKLATIWRRRDKNLQPGEVDECASAVHAAIEVAAEEDAMVAAFLVTKLGDALDPGQRADFIAWLRGFLVK